MHNYLQKIIENKKSEIAALKQAGLNVKKKHFPKKSFKQSLLAANGAVIAEIKRKSPSKNHLASITDPASLAKRYVAGGAAAVSVLTDSFGFNGAIFDLAEIAADLSNSACTVLRKDFILDPIQIDEAILYGANAVLLIVAVLGEQTKDLLDYAKAKHIDALVEVHSLDELNIAIASGAEIIGINNRNLTTFEVDIQHAKNLISAIPDDLIKVAESGIHTPELANEYLAMGFDAVLIGEALVTANDPEIFIQSIGRKS